MKVPIVSSQSSYGAVRSAPVITRRDGDFSTPLPPVEAVEKTEPAQKPNDRDLGRYVDITV